MVIKPELTEKDIKKIGHSLTDKISELQKQVKDFINRTKRRRKMSKLIKPRYEYYKGTTEIVDNELNAFIGDAVDRLNEQDFNKKELLKVKQNQDEEISKLKEELEQLKLCSIILPKGAQVGNKIFWANEDGVYSGKLCGVTKDINPNGGFNIWLYCLYDNGLSYWHLIKDYNVELFPAKEEAERKFAELKG